MATRKPPAAHAAAVSTTTAAPLNATPAPQSPAQTQRFQEKREAILSAAASLFNQHGVKGATLADIAHSVGLVTNSVTYYYRKKEDLATACFLRAIEVFSRIIESAARQGSVEARVHEFFRLHSALLADIDHGTHAPMMQFNDMRALPSPHFEVVSDAYNDMFRRLRELLRTSQTERLGRTDLAARTYAVLSVAHWVRGWIDRYETEEYARIGERVSHRAARQRECRLGLVGALARRAGVAAHRRRRRHFGGVLACDLAACQ